MQDFLATESDRQISEGTFTKKGTATMSRTTLGVPGWYIEFQAALLRQAPRPGEIDQVTAEGWTSNQKGLKNKLAGCLLPPSVTASADPPLDFIVRVDRSVMPSYTDWAKKVMNPELKCTGPAE